VIAASKEAALDWNCPLAVLPWVRWRILTVSWLGWELPIVSPSVVPTVAVSPFSRCRSFPACRLALFSSPPGCPWSLSFSFEASVDFDRSLLPLPLLSRCPVPESSEEAVGVLALLESVASP